MHPRPLHIAPLILRILQTISFCLAVTLAAGQLTHAQDQPSEKLPGDNNPRVQQPPADVQELANRLAPNLSRMHPIRVLVLDFKGPDNLWLPFSAWLADQFSAALGSVGKRPEVVPRSSLTAAITDRHLKPKDAFDTKTAEALAESLEAQVIVSGSFAATQDALGVALTYGEKEGDSWFVQSWRDDLRGKILLPAEVSASFGITLESLRPKDGVYHSGEGGVSIPSCIHCPYPQYSREAAAKKAQGTVMLLVTISAEGRATDIKVTKKSVTGSMKKPSRL